MAGAAGGIGGAMAAAAGSAKPQVSNSSKGSQSNQSFEALLTKSLESSKKHQPPMAHASHQATHTLAASSKTSGASGVGKA